MERNDILSNDTGLRVESNDLVFGASDKQHIEDTINAAPGWWVENFTDGVNIRAFLNSDGQAQVLSRKIKLQLQADLYNNCTPAVKFLTNGELQIDPKVIL